MRVITRLSTKVESEFYVCVLCAWLVTNLWFPQAQVAAAQHHAAVTAPPPGQQTTAVVATAGGGLYPSLEDYMGLNLAGYTPVSSDQLQCIL